MKDMTGQKHYLEDYNKMFFTDNSDEHVKTV